MTRVPRILVTNDDGIDSVGLHVLARAMVPLGDVVVVAPDTEYSGASAALGALHLLQPEVKRADVEGVAESWTVNGHARAVRDVRPARRVRPVDLVVAGINPGANVGRAIYHSGTVGAALTARNGGTSGVAVSQAVAEYGVEGQGWDEMIAGQHWDTAARVGATVVAAVLDDAARRAVRRQRQRAERAVRGDRRLAPHRRRRAPAADRRHRAAAPDRGPRRRVLASRWCGATPIELPPDTDSGAIERGVVAVSYLSRMQHEARPDLDAVADRLDALLGPTRTLDP